MEAGDAVTAELTALLARLAELADAATDPAPDARAALIDQIAVLERMRSSLAAAQHTAMVAFARTEVEVQAELVAAGRLDPEKLGRDIAAPDRAGRARLTHRGFAPVGRGADSGHRPAPHPGPAGGRADQ